MQRSKDNMRLFEISRYQLHKQFEEQNNQIDFLNKYIELLKKELDIVTALLFSTIIKIEDTGKLNELSQDHIEWFKKYKEFDKSKKEDF